MASRELPIVPPKPAFVSMPAAVAAAIAHDNTLADIRLDKWAETYRCGVEAIRMAWDAELTRRSQEPQNSYDSEGK
jgi:hypothetical protein